jgi:hypothetical protein
MHGVGRINILIFIIALYHKKYINSLIGSLKLPYIGGFLLEETA